MTQQPPRLPTLDKRFCTCQTRPLGPFGGGHGEEMTMVRSLVVAAICTALAVTLFTTVGAVAEPMHFEKIRNGGNCASCSYTQAGRDYVGHP